MSPVLRAAHRYVGELGWAVLPCIGKAPAVPVRDGGRGWASATRDHDEIDRLWRKHRPDSVGIAAKPSGLVILDVDPRDGGDERMAAIERDHGELPVTVRQLTGGGGEHVLFRAPADLDPVGSLGPGLQVKYAGYVIAAPSKHEKTRRPYAWSVDHHPLDVPVAEPPDWLRTLLRKPTAENGRPPPTDWKNPGLFDVRVGDRTTTLTRLAGLLFRKSVDPIAAYALLAAWNLQSCHPPLGAEKFEKTLEGIRNRELARRAAR